jgi:hypothetical protein
MVNIHVSGKVLGLAIVAATVVGLCAEPARAQSSSTDSTRVTLNEADYRAVQDATGQKHHAWPANTETAKNGRRSELSNAHQGTASAAAPMESATRYPGDLSYQGGPVVEYAESHPIYLFLKTGCTSAACWGTPATFLANLGASTFIHVTDQYTHNSADNRYTLGGSYHSTITLTSMSAPLTDQDMQAYAHAAAAAKGQDGYGHIYHIFLPPGQDVCFTATDGTCYSPDVPSTFYFCAYHGSVDFKDVGHVLYTVEPYQNVSGCQVEPGTPNGLLADSTASVLSHETFETITDPDGNAWWNTASLSLGGSEIGDECEFVTATSFDVPTFYINDKKYGVQREYNNARHACTEAP